MVATLECAISFEFNTVWDDLVRGDGDITPMKAVPAGLPEDAQGLWQNENSLNSYSGHDESNDFGGFPLFNVIDGSFPPSVRCNDRFEPIALPIPSGHSAFPITFFSLPV